MKILTAWSVNFEPLYNRWLKTLPRCFEPNAKLIEIPQDNFGCLSQSWYDAIKLKIQHFNNVLETLPEGEIVICCDCDIFFVRSNDELKKYITDHINKHNLDFLFMREGKVEQVNGGFYAVKNSSLVRKALSSAIQYCDKKTTFADQDFFNGVEFKTSGIKWDYIDYNLVAWAELIFNRRKTLFHHAVCTKNIEEKIKQQDKVARLLRFQFPK